MKEIVRQYAGTLIAVFIAGILLLVIMNGAQYLKNSGIGGSLDGRVLTASAGTFDRYWRGR